MPELWPQVCRVKITCELLLTICFVSTTTNSMKCLVNWIPLKTHVRFENTHSCLKNRILGNSGFQIKSEKDVELPLYILPGPASRLQLHTPPP